MGPIHLKNEGPNRRQRPTVSAATDGEISACPSDESTNHLQKHFQAIIPAARTRSKGSHSTTQTPDTRHTFGHVLFGHKVIPLLTRQYEATLISIRFLSMSPFIELMTDSHGRYRLIGAAISIGSGIRWAKYETGALIRAGSLVPKPHYPRTQIISPRELSMTLE